MTTIRFRLWWNDQKHRIAWWITMHLPYQLCLLVVARVWGRVSVGPWGNEDPTRIDYNTAWKRFEMVKGRRVA